MLLSAALSMALVSALPYSAEQHCADITQALQYLKLKNPYFFQYAVKKQNERVDRFIEQLNQKAKADNQIKFISEAIPFVIEEIFLQERPYALYKRKDFIKKLEFAKYRRNLELQKSKEEKII